MAIVMVAMLAFGGTYAYFTATANSTSSDTITTATVSLTNETETVSVSTNNILPGETAFGASGATINLKHGSTRDIYVFAKLNVTGGAAELVYKSGEDFLPIFDITSTADANKTDAEKGTTLDEAKWSPLAGNEGVYYIKVTAITGTEAEAVAEAFNFNATFAEGITSDNDETDGETTNVYDKDDTTTPVGVMGVSLTISVNFRAIQQQGLSVSQAWDAVKTAM